MHLQTHRDQRTGTPAFAARLHEDGRRPALVHADGTVWSRAETAERADEVGRAIGAGRRLVAVPAGADPASVVAHLGALRAGHVVLLLPPDGPATASLVEAWDPDVVLSGRPDGGVELRARRDGSAHQLHPSLTLLMSTSGSTGAPKLVRLSGEGVDANASAIASYLGLTPDDRAAMTLPLHYCYGLSVVHSHLAAGASVLLGGGSVVDLCFWDRFVREGCTSFAAVPHTFELLDRVGFAGMDLPQLRQVTQAGGRLAPDLVQRYAALGERDGWELVVMYGQTEATARMAYLPPHLAGARPDAIGRAIPGGELWVEPLADGGDRPDDVGELVYRGPNVMMGYARTPDDLAAGRDLHVLRTGDLGRQGPDGLFEVVGRLSRFVKPFGVRVDLDEVERGLADAGRHAVCAGDDELLAVGLLDGDDDGDRLAAELRERLGLPRGALVVVALPERPLLANGKTDHRGVLAAGRAARREPAPARPGTGGATATSPVRAVMADVLGVDEVGDDDTFVSLGGDSLSYVEVSTALEEHIGELPPGWHTTPVGRLDATTPVRRRRWAAVEGNVALRALAIVLVVGTHASLFRLQAGAHVLLAVAGYNFARFRLTATEAVGRLRQSGASIARIAVPSVLWVCFMFTWREQFSLPRLLLLDNVAGEGLWRYWYVEVLLQLLVLLTVLLGLRAVRDAERRSPFTAALVVLGAALALRFGWSPLPSADEPMYRTDTVAWLFALGWAAQRARRPRERAVVTAAALLAVPGFFDETGRALLVVVGLLALVWVPTLRVPRPLNRLVAALAAASLAIFLTHFAVLPWLRGHLPPLAVVVVALTVGVGVAAVLDRVRPLAAAGRLLRGTGGRGSLRRASGPVRRAPATPAVATGGVAVRSDQVEGAGAEGGPVGPPRVEGADVVAAGEGREAGRAGRRLEAVGSNRR